MFPFQKRKAIAGSPISLHTSRRLFVVLSLLSDVAQQDHISSSSSSDKSGVGKRGGDGAGGGALASTFGLVLVQLVVQLTADMCSKQYERRYAFRASCLGGASRFCCIT